MRKREIVLGASVLVIVGLIIYGLYNLNRWVNWELGYESEVVETICAMIKPEYIIDGKCD